MIVRTDRWQGQRESNPQPSVLETDALPVELYPCGTRHRHTTTLATTPAPTVRPPSRIAKRRPCSIAIGAISVTTIFTLSPGITISVPPGNATQPVTSVVRTYNRGRQLLKSGVGRPPAASARPSTPHPPL